MLHTWKPQLKRCYSLIEPSATSTSTRLFNWIFLSCQRDRHPFYACCVWLLVFCTFARFHGICLGNKVARARIKVMNGFPRGPTTTSILVTSSSIQKWIWPGLITIHRSTNIRVPMWYFTQSHTLKMIFLFGYIKEASLSFWLFIHLMLFFFFLVCHRANVLIGQCFRRLWSNLPYWWLQKKSHHHQFCLLHQDKKTVEPEHTFYKPAWL